MIIYSLYSLTSKISHKVLPHTSKCFMMSPSGGGSGKMPKRPPNISSTPGKEASSPFSSEIDPKHPDSWNPSRQTDVNTWVGTKQPPTMPSTSQPQTPPPISHVGDKPDIIKNAARREKEQEENESRLDSQKTEWVFEKNDSSLKRLTEEAMKPVIVSENKVQDYPPNAEEDALRTVEQAGTELKDSIDDIQISYDKKLKDNLEEAHKLDLIKYGAAGKHGENGAAQLTHQGLQHLRDMNRSTSTKEKAENNDIDEKKHDDQLRDDEKIKQDSDVELVVLRIGNEVAIPTSEQMHMVFIERNPDENVEVKGFGYATSNSGHRPGGSGISNPSLGNPKISGQEGTQYVVPINMKIASEDIEKRAIHPEYLEDAHRKAVLDQIREDSKKLPEVTYNKEVISSEDLDQIIQRENDYQDSLKDKHESSEKNDTDNLNETY